MYDTTEVICGWRIEGDDSVCVAPSWHDGAAHHMVSIHELEASA